mmetsp:Transcript_56857/g.144144  ORF Transcript_56857/g.144144 Transcript_56857/m.144144 type:complete len:224 (-) Transcript_56857:104-775(-)
MAPSPRRPQSSRFAASLLLALCAAALLGQAFTGFGFRAPSRTQAVSRRAGGPLEGLRGPLEAVAKTSLEVNPALKEFPKPVLVWLHPVAQAVVFIAFAYGVYLGWQVRTGKGEEPAFVLPGLGSGPLPASEAHPLYMRFALGVFLFNAIGGIINLAALGQPILESDHALTAVAGLVLLVLQAVLPALFSIAPAARTAHAYLGSATALLLVAHAALGTNLGLSL